MLGRGFGLQRVGSLPCPVAIALVAVIHYPSHTCAARGKVVGGGVHFFIFYLSKYSLSEVYFNTDRLLIKFNGLWYNSLAARQVFVAIANLYTAVFWLVVQKLRRESAHARTFDGILN